MSSFARPIEYIFSRINDNIFIYYTSYNIVRYARAIRSELFNCAPWSYRISSVDDKRLIMIIIIIIIKSSSPRGKRRRSSVWREKQQQKLDDWRTANTLNTAIYATTCMPLTARRRIHMCVRFCVDEIEIEYYFIACVCTLCRAFVLSTKHMVAIHYTEL